jgi:hypothetical protein
MVLHFSLKFLVERHFGPSITAQIHDLRRVQLCSEVLMQDDKPRSAAVQLRLGSLFDLVENWRRSQVKIPPRSEAIRELVRRAIEAEQQSVAQ